MLLFIQASETPLGGAMLFAAACSPRRIVWALGPILRQYLVRSVARLNAALTPMFTIASQPAGNLVKRRVPVKSTATSESSVQLSPFFTSSSEMEAFAEEIVTEAPTAVATIAFVKALQVRNPFWIFVLFKWLFSPALFLAY